jgi:hypothetical protein
VAVPGGLRRPRELEAHGAAETAAGDRWSTHRPPP